MSSKARKLRKIKKRCIAAIAVIALSVSVFNTIRLEFLIKKYEIDLSNMLNQMSELKTDIKAYNKETSCLKQDNKKEAKTPVSFNKELIERVVAAEARGDTFNGIMAVAQTIKDRGDLWNMSYEDIVLQEGQYASPYQGEISEEVKLAVSLVFEQGIRVSQEPMTHFFAGETPYWANNKVSRGSCGSIAHTFMY